MDGIEQILQEDAQNNKRHTQHYDTNGQQIGQAQDASFLSGNDYGATGTAKKKREQMSPNPFEIKLRQEDEESLDELQALERTMSAGKEDGGIQREPLNAQSLN